MINIMNFKSPSKCLAWLLLFFMVSACKKDNTSSATFALKDNPTLLEATEDGTSATYTVESNGTWEVQPLRAERWLKIFPAKGNGSGTFTVTIDRNHTLEARQTTLTFMVDGRIQNHALKVIQKARSASNEEGEQYVRLQGLSNLQLPEEGINNRFVLQSTGKWRIEIIEGDDWLNISPMEGNFDTGITISVGANASEHARNGKLAFYLDDQLFVDDFSIQQEGMEVILQEDFNWLNYGSPIFYTTTGETRIDAWKPEDLERGWTSTINPADGGGNYASTYARQGFIKLGRTNFGGDIISPKLTTIEGVKNLIVRFKAVPYMTAAGNGDGGTSLKVSVIGPGTVSQNEFNINNWPDYTADPNCTEIWKAAETTRSFTITGATAETQIRFLGGDFDLRNPPAGVVRGNLNRIFLDDILVAVQK